MSSRTAIPKTSESRPIQPSQKAARLMSRDREMNDVTPYAIVHLQFGLSLVAGSAKDSKKLPCLPMFRIDSQYFGQVLDRRLSVTRLVEKNG